MNEAPRIVRLLASKERKLARAGKKPALPNFEELLAMEVALYIYQILVTAEWHTQEPIEWARAAKVKKATLVHYFPDVHPQTLSEILMAYGDDIQATVEVISESTGISEISIVKRELARQKNNIAEQKKALSEGDWSQLPRDTKLSLKVVKNLRSKAGAHLNKWKECNERAIHFCQKDMTQVAAHFCAVAALHKQVFENANSLAGATVMQLNAAKKAKDYILDLHNHHVPEAKVALDLFIDYHVERLRKKNGQKCLISKYSVEIITGKGLHSVDQTPRIKPAVLKRLDEREVKRHFKNPGSLVATVSAHTRMTYELP